MKMRDMTELLLGRKQVEIVSNRTLSECVHSLQILNRPRKMLQKMGTVAEITQGAASYQIKVHKERYFFRWYFSLNTVSFSGDLGNGSTGKVALRGVIAFSEWFFIGIGLTLALTIIWTLGNPGYGPFSIIFIVFVLALLYWFARGDEEALLREIEFALIDERYN